MDDDKEEATEDSVHLETIDDKTNSDDGSYVIRDAITARYLDL